MNWIWRAVKALWGRMMVRVDNLRLAGLERKQRAARGVVAGKRKNPSFSAKFPNGIHR